MCAKEMQRFGITPKVALLSNSNYGSIDNASSSKMQEALKLIQAQNPELQIDGEMQGDVAMMEDMRQQIFPESTFKGSANLLVIISSKPAGKTCR